MRDARTSNGIWTRDPSMVGTSERDINIEVAGDPHATEIRSTWKTAAIIQVFPTRASFLIGWKTKEFPEPEFWSLPISAPLGLVGMLVGDKDVTFVIRPLSEYCVRAELSDRADKNDAKYSGIPHY